MRLVASHHSFKKKKKEQYQLVSVSLVRQQKTSSFESFDLDESIESLNPFELQL